MAEEEEQQQEQEQQAIIANAIEHVQRVLRKLHASELDGHSARGMTELAFKQLFIAYFEWFHAGDGGIEVESEFPVEGGRIDIFLLDRARRHIDIIELKYCRIGFLEAARIHTNASPLEKARLWKRVNNEICEPGYAWQSIGCRQYFLNERGTKRKTLRSVKQICTEAVLQALNYRRLLQNNPIRHIHDDYDTCSCHVIVGIGSRVEPYFHVDQDEEDTTKRSE